MRIRLGDKSSNLDCLVIEYLLIVTRIFLLEAVSKIMISYSSAMGYPYSRFQFLLFFLDKKK